MIRIPTVLGINDNRCHRVICYKVHRSKKKKELLVIEISNDPETIDGVNYCITIIVNTENLNIVHTSNKMITYYDGNSVIPIRRQSGSLVHYLYAIISSLSVGN